METASRRSRMRRTNTGKRLELSPRDIAIFKLLSRYRYLRSTFIHAFVGGASENRFKERLCDLYHEGTYLERPVQQWQFANCRYMPVVYELGERGERLLREQGWPHENPVIGTSNGFHGIRPQFAHTLMVCEAMACFELGAAANPHLRFIDAMEILARAPEATQRSDYPFRIPVPHADGGKGTAASAGLYSHVEPDGLFGLEYKGNGENHYRFFALEADRDTMPVARSDPRQSSYMRKFLAYREILAGRVFEAHLKIPNPLILTVTASEANMAQMIDKLFALTGGSKAFLFKTMKALGSSFEAPQPSPDLLVEPWQRAGFPHIRIDRVV